jgi:hypothetical protein
VTNPERTRSDAEALDEIAAMYQTWGDEICANDTSSTLESIGNIIESSGRTAWVEVPGYLQGQP